MSVSPSVTPVNAIDYGFIFAKEHSGKESAN